jgi:hypothetical protein
MKQQNVEVAAWAIGIALLVAGCGMKYGVSGALIALGGTLFGWVAFKDLIRGLR